MLLLDRASFSCSPLRLESATNFVDASGQVDVQAAEVVAGPVAHRNNISVSRAIDCDIALAIWELTGNSLIVASLSCDALIHGDSPELIPQDR